MKHVDTAFCVNYIDGVLRNCKYEKGKMTCHCAEGVVAGVYGVDGGMIHRQHIVKVVIGNEHKPPVDKVKRPNIQEIVRVQNLRAVDKDCSGVGGRVVRARENRNDVVFDQGGDCANLVTGQKVDRRPALVVKCRAVKSRVSETCPVGVKDFTVRYVKGDFAGCEIYDLGACGHVCGVKYVHAVAFKNKELISLAVNVDVERCNARKCNRVACGKRQNIFVKHDKVSAVDDINKVIIGGKHLRTLQVFVSHVVGGL